MGGESWHTMPESLPFNTLKVRPIDIQRIICLVSIADSYKQIDISMHIQATRCPAHGKATEHAP